VDLSKIVRCAIHPAIGIARVGNSEEWFVGPEIPGVTPKPTDGYKDATGKIKRQVARFRIYGYDDQNKPLGEVTADEADITWTVHVANKKAAWYQVQEPLDIPTPLDPDPIKRRNCSQGDRTKLVLDPGERTLCAPGQSATFDSVLFSVDYFHDGGEAPVELGAISMEEGSGRLLFFAAKGQAGTTIADAGINDAANNDTWYDDTCDGPVTATVKIHGHDAHDPLEVTSAWIISAPPDYSPGIRSIVTLYDVVYEVALKHGYRSPPEVSFTQHIYPILERFCQLQWVNEGFNEEFGWGRPGHLLETATLTRLSRASAATDAERQELRAERLALFNRFRMSNYSEVETEPEPTKLKLPVIFGDDPMAKAVPGLRRKYLAVTDLQYSWLQQWADGNFAEDWTGSPPRPPAFLKDLKPDEQTRALDRAALEPCVGGPFHPGCEAPWTLRTCLMYEKPFRIKRRAAPAPDFGDELDRTTVLAAGGPLDGSEPGDLTKWMAVPWQADTYWCAAYFGVKRRGSSPTGGKNVGYLPTFWPARVPTHVLPEATYNEITNANPSILYRRSVFGSPWQWLWVLTKAAGATIISWNPQASYRQALFWGVRPEWVRLLDRETRKDRMFTKGWSYFGIVTREVGRGGDLPEIIHVERGVPDNLPDILANL
jgi:hypothetical protein